MNQHPYIHGLFLFLLFTATWGMEGCKTSPPAARIIHEDPTRIVRLEVTEPSSKQERHHPGIISPEALAHILRAITVEARLPSPEQQGFAYMSHAPGPKSSYAFTSKEVEFLAQQLSKALQQATPLEDIVFYLDAQHQNELHEVTTGQIYLQDDQLHIQFANYRHPIMGISEISKIKAQPLNVFALPHYTLVPGPHGKIIHEKGWRTALTALSQHLVFPGPESRPPDLPFAKTTAPPQTPKVDRETFSEQLRELQSLRDDGHLSEPEFQKLRQRLLNEY